MLSGATTSNGASVAPLDFACRCIGCGQIGRRGPECECVETDTPIVPVAIVGSEEQHPSFANLEGVARMFGAPALPITPTFPWLGPLGLLPLPVKYHIYFGEPLRFDGEASDEDANIDAKVDEVKAKIAGLLARGRREREGVFS